jgi:hypothetical protein
MAVTKELTERWQRMTFGRLRRHWYRLSWASQVMLVLSMLTSTAAAVIWALILWLSFRGYAVGGNGIVFPAWYPVLVYGGVPCTVICGLTWAGYLLLRRRRTSARHEGPAGSRR